MTRRRFALAVGAALGGVLTATLPACFLSSIYRDLEKYVPLALLAFERIIDILTEHGVAVAPQLTDTVNGVKAALADIQAAILTWETSRGDSTAIELIRGAIRLAIIALQDFQGKLILPPQLAGTVRALFEIITSTLAGFEVQLPARAAPGGARAFVSSGQVRTVGEFRADFNRVLAESKESKFQI